MTVEVAAGVISGSLALLADAAHMLTDAGAIGLALFAIWIGNRPASIKRTFGYYRTEVLAALFNVVSLWVLAGWVFLESWKPCAAGYSRSRTMTSALPISRYRWNSRWRAAPSDTTSTTCWREPPTGGSAPGG